ncbi:MAG TPA: 4'-phosphopantetheinyl transferase superfamily protein [Blastococcus sp.]|nr:4'-phosphopantetheinyl transferase superfamily protein [Blastococcus sp.]
MLDVPLDLRVRPTRIRRVDPSELSVAVRLVDLDADPEQLRRAESVLSPAERARARRGTSTVHRRRVMLRAALRAALGNELSQDPAAVQLGTSASGRPFPMAASRALLDANCSASGDLGVIAVGRACRVGIDVEGIAPWSADTLVEGWLSAAEQAALQSLPVEERALAATRCWTQKEAVLKARGTGLLDDPCTIVTPVGCPTGVVAGWTVEDVPVPRGWVATLALGPLKEMPA